jgi:hypothetical protein
MLDAVSENKPMITFTVSTRRTHPLEIVKVFDSVGRLDQLTQVFGSLFDSPLNGGRNREGPVRYDLDVIDKLIDMGIGYEFTLTYLAATLEHFRDRYTNQILKRFENPLNSVLTSKYDLAYYIKKKYPQYKLRASCMYYFETAAEIDEACELFDSIALFPTLNEKPEELKKIKNKEKVVLFGTQVCLKRCGRYSLQHYYFWSLDHIAWYNHKTYKVPYNKKCYEWKYLSPCVAQDCSTEMEDFDKFAEMGFNRFKITQFDYFQEHYLGIKPTVRSRALFGREFFKRK